MTRIAEGPPQRFVFLVGLPDSKDHAECRDEHLARRKRTDDPDPNLPVESDRPKGGLDRMAKPAAQAVR